MLFYFILTGSFYALSYQTRLDEDNTIAFLSSEYDFKKNKKKTCLFIVSEVLRIRQ